MGNSSGQRTENDSGELQMKNYSNTIIMGFKWKTVSGGRLAAGKKLQWLVLKGEQYGLSMEMTVASYRQRTTAIQE